MAVWPDPTHGKCAYGHFNVFIFVCSSALAPRTLNICIWIWVMLSPFTVVYLEVAAVGKSYEAPPVGILPYFIPYIYMLSGDCWIYIYICYPIYIYIYAILYIYIYIYIWETVECAIRRQVARLSETGMFHASDPTIRPCMTQQSSWVFCIIIIIQCVFF